ncbi:MAG: hypothetical protein M3R68_04745 [Acidobacteriota bacterium]|nr:hypothetical protein [Acidobacteriota bacterium]
MFEQSATREKGLVVLLWRAFLLVAGLYCVTALISGYRAWFQVKSLELQAAESILHTGAAVKTRVVTYARTTVEVRLELIQGAHAETLAVQNVAGNYWAFMDPRQQQGSQTALLSDEVLGHFQPGRAQLRATATGRPQWTRLPPPVVRELTVEIQRN